MVLGEYVWYWQVSQSPVMKEIFDVVPRVANTDASVLIFGETGTGKELVARAIQAAGKRCTNPFISVDCSAVPKDDLYLSAFFGHVKGAFTTAVATQMGYFPMADTGTLFFDEVSNLSHSAQQSLLRALQENKYRPVGSKDEFEFDCRIISASNQDLELLTEKGEFRRDLLERLNVFPIYLSPLRARREDIGAIADYYCKEYAQKYKVRVVLSNNAVEALRRYNWPSNIRQLMHVVERSILALDIPDMSRTERTHEIDAFHINRFIYGSKNVAFPDKSETDGSETATNSNASNNRQLYKGSMEDIEREAIIERIRSTGSISKAALSLGIGRQTIGIKLKGCNVNLMELKNS